MSHPVKEKRTVETGERLAAYAAGELDADETRALEAELARDPSLRAQLASIRATDELLAGLAPVEVPAAFSSRLRAAVDAELDAVLGDPSPTDELAARRQRRATAGGWGSWQRLAAAAAALVVLGGVGVGLVNGFGGDDSAEVASDGGVALESALAPEPAEGPTVVAAGRSFDTASLTSLAEDSRFDEILSERLSGPEASIAAEQHETAIAPGGGADSSAAGDAAITSQDEATAEGDGARTLDAPAAGSDFGLRTVGEVSEADLGRVRACLPAILDSGSPVIPVYAELATFEGTDAIVYGLVGNDPEQDSYRRVELWVVDRADCQVLHFAQVDR